MNKKPSPTGRHRRRRNSQETLAVGNRLPPPRDEALLATFHERDGSPLSVVLRNGSILTVFNIAWGYDVGDEYSHVTSNVSPDVEGSPIDLFFTNDVDHVLDPATGAMLFVWP